MGSFVWVIMLAVAAAVVSLLPPDLAPSLLDRLSIAAVLTLLGAGAICALWNERVAEQRRDAAKDALERQRDDERDALAAERHATLSQDFERLQAKIAAVVAVQPAVRQAPAYQQLMVAEEQVRVSLATTAPLKAITSLNVTGPFSPFQVVSSAAAILPHRAKPLVSNAWPERWQKCGNPACGAAIPVPGAAGTTWIAGPLTCPACGKITTVSLP